MGEFIKYGRALAIASIFSRVSFAIALLVSALAFAFGDGGTLTISWVPGGSP